MNCLKFSLKNMVVKSRKDFCFCRNYVPAEAISCGVENEFFIYKKRVLKALGGKLFLNVQSLNYEISVMVFGF